MAVVLRYCRESRSVEPKVTARRRNFSRLARATTSSSRRGTSDFRKKKTQSIPPSASGYSSSGSKTRLMGSLGYEPSGFVKFFPSVSMCRFREGPGPRDLPRPRAGRLLPRDGGRAEHRTRPSGVVDVVRLEQESRTPSKGRLHEILLREDRGHDAVRILRSRERRRVMFHDPVSGEAGPRCDLGEFRERLRR